MSIYNNFLAITLIELDNSEAPNIGTIISDTGSNDELMSKAKEALESHFDAELATLTIQDGLNLTDVRNSYPLDASASFDDTIGTYNIEIQQTFVY